MRQVSDAPSWLVKSGDRVMGPFTTETVIEKLRSREVVVIDEIISPLGRWRYIREEPIFAAAVDEIRRNLANSREDTEVQSSTQVLTNLTPTPTFPDHSITSAPSTMDHGPIHGGSIRDAEFEEKSLSPSGASNIFGQLRQYGSGDERHLKSRVSRFSLAVWLAAVVLVTASGWFFFRSKFSSAENESAIAVSSFRGHLKDGEAAWRRGEFDLALSAFQKAELAKPHQPEVVTKLAPLMIQIDGETVAAKRLIQDSLERTEKLDSKDRSELNLALGLAALHADDFDTGMEYFRTALRGTPLSFSAGFNTAMASFLKKNYSIAAQQFGDLGDDPASLFMAANSILESGAEPKKIKTADKIISRLLARHAVYRLEALVLGAYADVLAGNSRNSAVRVISALEMDPEQTDEHWRDPMLFVEPLRWSALRAKCDRIDAKLNSAASKALQALCLAKSGQHDNAVEILDRELSARPDDPNLKAVQIYLLMTLGREDDARAALKLAEQSGSSVMTQVMRARLCQRQMDAECAERTWGELVRQKPRILSALTGMAQVRLSQGRQSEALDFVNKAQMASPRYLPAMRLREEIR